MIRKASVTGGTVVGIPAADPRVTAFKGIPFAAPPVGENRWRAPQPVVPWEGERKCFTFAPISMQHIPGLDLNNIYSREWNVDPTIPMSEDCLYLNVWTPAKSADERLPVFVWFFGGGLREGNTSEMEFDGERIARRGIVVVTVNYRVAVFGFLAHPELTARQPDAPSNFGHLDQLTGIRWARENIAAFGGDPDNITIGGQSAGGGSVCAQLTSPLTEGLFRKAVIMSGITASMFPNPIRNPHPFSEDEATGVRFFEHLGVKTLDEARALDAVYIRDKCNEFETLHLHLRHLGGRRVPDRQRHRQYARLPLPPHAADDHPDLQRVPHGPRRRRHGGVPREGEGMLRRPGGRISRRLRGRSG